MPRSKHWSAFYSQRYSGAKRSIDFHLTFDQWLSIWTESGKLAQRGKRSGQYVMARFGDRGPYVVGNVKIITFNQNISEANKGTPKKPAHKAWLQKHCQKLIAKNKGCKQPPRSLEFRAAMSKALTGHVVSEETRRKISETKRGCKISAQARAAMSAASKGRVKSVDHRNSISAALLKFHANKQSKEQIS